MCSEKHIFYNWNIFVSKMSKLLLKVKEVPHEKEFLYLYDGPDYNSRQYYFTANTTFTSSSFQVSILCHDYYRDVIMNFNGFLSKETKQNYKTIFLKKKDSILLISRDLKCSQRSMVLCAFNIKIIGNFFVNVTLLFVNYSGPNIGYCKYGGLSVYDKVKNNTQEMLLLCNNWLSLSSNIHTKRTIVSTTNSLFLVFYSYLSIQ